MKRDHLEITEPLAKMESENDLEPETVYYQPHPDYPRVLIDMNGIDAAQGRLNSFLGIILPREAIYQVVSAYLGHTQRLREDEE